MEKQYNKTLLSEGKDAIFNWVRDISKGKIDIVSFSDVVIMGKEMYWTLLEPKEFGERFADEEAKRLIDEIRDESNGDLDGYFDNGKKIVLMFLRKNYTAQQRSKLIESLENLTLEEYEPR